MQLENVIKTILDEANLIHLSDNYYHITQRTIETDGVESSGIAVEHIETGKLSIFTGDYLASKHADFYRDRVTRDVILEYLNADEADEELNIDLSVELCDYIGTDSGSRDCIMFADGRESLFDFENNYTLVVYEDEEFLIFDGEMFGTDLFVIALKEKIKNLSN